MNISPMVEQKVSQGLEQRILSLLQTDYNFIVGDKVQRMFVKDISSIVSETTKTSWQLDIGQVLWLAVDANEKHHFAKSRKNLRLVPVILTVVAEEDIDMLKNGFSAREVRQYRAVRLFREAYAQGGLLTHADVALILNISTGTVGKDMKAYMEANKVIIPTRGIMHDIGPGVTHKDIVIDYHESGYLLPDVSMKSRHSEQSCQRYITAYERVKLAGRKHGVSEISRMLGMSPRLVKHYLLLARKYGHIVKEVM